MTRTCKNCNCRIVYLRSAGYWYHDSSGAARCFDDASFTFAEPQ